MGGLDVPFKNTQRRAAYIWLFIGALGTFMAFMPSLFDIDIFDGGGALILLGIFAAISGVLVSILFFKRSKVIESAFMGSNYLIHWKYDANTWNEYAEKDFNFRKGINKALFLLIGGMCLIVGVIFWVIDPDGGKYVFLVMLGVTIIIGITAILSAKISYRRNKKSIGEVYIFNDGLYINKQTHIWKGFTARLDRVSIDRKDSLLRFVYSAITRTGRQSYTVLVPIPLGEEQNAESILRHFN